MVAEFFCLVVRVLCLYINFSVMCIVKKDFLPSYKLSFAHLAAPPAQQKLLVFTRSHFSHVGIIS